MLRLIQILINKELGDGYTFGSMTPKKADLVN